MDGVFLMVVLIVLISCATSVAQKYIRLRQRELNVKTDDDLREELRAVKKRIAVLEAIVTDQKFNLSKEIKNLENR